MCNCTASSRWRAPRNDEENLKPFFFGSNFSTGPPASRQAAKPPAIWATGFSPMSCAVLAASAERRPPAQWKMNFLSSWKIGLA